MAQLMLHREVLRNFGKLPAKVQKKTYELIRKFEEDSTQASIHLEPLHPMVRDPKVRSARIGDDYRAIVIAPEVGDTFLLMYADHHDEAYRWCKNKQFEAHGATGTLQVFDVEQARAIIEETSEPVSKMENSSHALDSLSDGELFQAGVPDALIPAVRAVRTDDTFLQLCDYLPKEAVQVLLGFIDGMTLDEALEEMLGMEKVSVPENSGDFTHLADSASMDLVLVHGHEHLKEILSEDIEEWRIFLHPYQKKLVEWRTKGPMKINGAAGTGKTVALMHRAAHLAGELSLPDEKILITTYTTNLSVTIKALIEQLAPELFNRIEVTNLHQLARTICHRVGWRGKIAGSEDLDDIWVALLKTHTPENFDQDFIVSEYREIIDPMGIDTEEIYLTTVRSGRKRISRRQRKQLWQIFVLFNRALNRRNMLTFDGVIHQARQAVEQGKFQKFRHVLVDELQDFGLEALRLIAALSPIDADKPDPLCVVGDGHQRIYSKTPVALSRAGIEVRGRSRRLKINYRTTEEIRQWAHQRLVGLDIDDLDGGKAVTIGDQSVFRGAPPETVTCDTTDDASQAIISWIKGLTAAGLGSHEICITPNNTKMINALESAGIQTLELKARQKDPGQEEPGVRYGTKQRIKGLEFRAVAMLFAEEDDSSTARFADYVAATRAREHLLILTLPTLSS